MVKCIKIIKFRVDLICVAFENKPLAVLVGDQGNDLIAQLGQESTRACAGVSSIIISDDAGIRTA